MILGSGPIVIGQACEFDYSGTQACRALKAEGYRVILVNSNPATIMTDPQLADATYIEPLHWQHLAAIIAREKPDALLPTMGGQTALNCALDLERMGILAAHNVDMIGANKEAIDKAEDREKFADCMEKIGIKTTLSKLAHSMDEAWQALDVIGFPAIIRPSFTMGGSGGGIAYNKEEYEEICRRGLSLSPTTELLIDRSIIGWKEFELEVVRDKKDNVIIICSIENIDPMGIHTGDSITVAPAQTLRDKEYQRMRDAAIAVLREIGVDTGGANVQFAMNPKTDEIVVIEMNPRVSRSSALASKATGFPIAKVAALLAVGYTLDELRNDITDGKTPASFEPTIDYVVIKMPRFDFQKFPEANAQLTTQMKSVGEVMAIGSNFAESLQKAIRGLETGFCGFEPLIYSLTPEAHDKIVKKLTAAEPERLWYIADAFRANYTLENINKYTGIDPWFLLQIENIVKTEKRIGQHSLTNIGADDLFWIKQQGFSDQRLAQLLNTTEDNVREHRIQLNIQPVFKHVDSCAAEFPTETSYIYSTYAQENEFQASGLPTMMILGGGPNRIGQGLEFDYCCVHAALALRDQGFQTVMMNCNPETVSTDFGIADILCFEPLSYENVMNAITAFQPRGIVVQYGGQTPLKLASRLEKAGAPIIGTSATAIDRAEDREQFQELVNQLGLQQPANGTVRSIEEGKRLAKVLAYPLVVRPSFVLGGHDMRIIYNQHDFMDYMNRCPSISASSPLLLDHFLEDAIEVDIDAVCDGKDIVIGGILEHIEQAGVHSGDSSCTLPPHSLSAEKQEELKDQLRKMTLALNVKGLVNAQFAIKNDEIYILEVNPRASRTVPFVSKASGLSLARIGALCMAGISLEEQGITEKQQLPFYAVKKPVFPFNKFPNFDPRLGPEMRSTGEVMGLGHDFGSAFAKAQSGSGHLLPSSGQAFLSVMDHDKPALVEIARLLQHKGFSIVATKGTAQFLENQNIHCRSVQKVSEGRPNIVDMIKNDEIDFIINVSKGRMAASNSRLIRQSAIAQHVCYNTTLAGGKAAAMAIGREIDGAVISVQERLGTEES